jgi:predicted HD phosphohydrolase
MINKNASFTRMDQATQEDWQIIEHESKILTPLIADNVLEMLKTLKGKGRAYKIDRYEHSLQTATRAYKDEAEEEVIVVALLHDIGDLVSPQNHSEFAASILRPYVSQNNCWLVEHHGLFQGYYYYHFLDLDRNERQKYFDHPAYQNTVDFCELWDQRSFDPDYENLPLSFFEPMVRNIFSRRPWQWNA